MNVLLVSVLCFEILLIVDGSTSNRLRDTCPPLLGASTPHGRIKKWSRSKIQVICDQGYKVFKSPFVFCQQGNWTNGGYLPECQLRPRFCEPPKDIKNGRLQGSKHHRGSTVRYRCLPGYTLVGSSKRFCSFGLYWTPALPKCLSKSEKLDKTSRLLNEQFVQKMVPRSDDSPILGARILGYDVNKVGLDLTILIDRSSSIDPDDFKIGIGFVNALLGEFGVKNGKNIKGGTRLAVVTFGDKSENVIKLDDEKVSSVDKAKKIINTIKPGGGSTNLISALTNALINSQLTVRPKVKKALFIMTDGKPNNGKGDPPEVLVKHLKNKGYEVFTVGIGRQINQTLMKILSSKPEVNHNFHFDEYSNLDRVMWWIRNEAKQAPPPEANKCGYLAPTNKKWPWLVTIWTEVPVEKRFSLKLCTGILICRRWVLTTAHCLHYYQRRRVKLASHVFVTVSGKDIMKWDERNENFHSVKVISHPSFSIDTFKNDLALIKLNKDIALSDHVKIACLPRIGIYLSRQPLRNSTVAGWGITSDKLFEDPPVERSQFKRRSESLRFIPSRDCFRRALKLNCTSPELNQFCAETSNELVQKCTIGTGSPVMMLDDSGYDKFKRHRVVGLVSSGCGCGKNNGYRIHTRIYDHLKWIDDNSESCHRKYA